MPQLYEVKVRQVGSSLGLLLPKEIVEAEKLKPGKRIEIAVYRRATRNEMLRRLRGIVKNPAPFEREKDDREL